MRRTLAMLAAAVIVAAAPNAEANPGAGSRASHRVQSGQVLSEIAQRYGVTVGELCRENGLRQSDVIRPGQRLRIPEHESPPSASKANRKAKARKMYRPPRGASWAPYVKPAERSGYITIAGHGRSWAGYVVGPSDEILPRARDRFAWVLASWRSGKRVSIDDRLIRLTVEISDVFGGRQIRIVSGYRERSHARNSRHKTGRALDFSIPGVPNEALRDYLKTLPNTGVGYYPRSTHVHLDVRDRNSYWVDYSRPGQRPKYGRKVPGGASPPKMHREQDDDETADPTPRAENEQNVALPEPAVAHVTQ